jgi:hypothetical protein
MLKTDLKLRIFISLFEISTIRTPLDTIFLIGNERDKTYSKCKYVMKINCNYRHAQKSILCSNTIASIPMPSMLHGCVHKGGVVGIPWIVTLTIQACNYLSRK